jgi:hypothetical protein
MKVLFNLLTNRCVNGGIPLVGSLERGLLVLLLDLYFEFHVLVKERSEACALVALQDGDDVRGESHPLGLLDVDRTKVCVKLMIFLGWHTIERFPPDLGSMVQLARAQHGSHS